MTKYDLIVEELQNRVESGELDLEFAEAVNDLAYERYVMEAATEATIVGSICTLCLGSILHDTFKKIKSKKIVDYFKKDTATAIKEYEARNPNLIKVSDMTIKTISVKQLISQAKKYGFDNESLKKISHNLIDYPEETTVDAYLYKNECVVIFLYNKERYKEFNKHSVITSNLPSFYFISRVGHSVYYEMNFIMNKIGAEYISKYFNDEHIYNFAKK